MAGKDEKTSEGPLHNRGSLRYGLPDAFERSRERTVAAFVGEERRPDVFAGLRTATPTIKSLVDDFRRRHFRPDLLLTDDIKAAWTEVVGDPGYAAMLRPLSVKGGVLTVEAANATVSYAYANPAMKRAFLAKLKRLGFDEVNAIRVVLPGQR